MLGQELRGVEEAVLVAARRRLGFILQAHNLHESLTALQNVRMATCRGPRRPRRTCSACSASDRLHYWPASLSGGQKQRVAVARALVGNPEIVFADEPSAALHRDSGRTGVEMLKRLGGERGTTMLMVTHDTRILELADRIVTLEDGRLMRDEPLSAPQRVEATSQPLAS